MRAIQKQSPCLDYLIDLCFQGVNKLFLLSFEDNNDKTGHKGYFMSSVEIKGYNVMINRQNFFEHPGKRNIRTYNNILKIAQPVVYYFIPISMKAIR